MRVGTKSVLFGAHQCLIHPWFVAAAWWQLYGFPRDPRLWVAFFVHDLGYIGKPNMDGPEGERHPELGARIMRRLFDGAGVGEPGRWVVDADDDNAMVRVRWSLPDAHGAYLYVRHYPGTPWGENACEGEAERFNKQGRVPEEWPAGYTMPLTAPPATPWHDFTLLHSRYYAKTLGKQPSRLCIADKLAIALTPAWLYLPMVRATGEIREYMAHAKHRLVGNQQISEDERRRLTAGNEREWYAGVRSYCRRWAYAHRDGAIDTWTSDARQRATVNDAGVWQ